MLVVVLAVTVLTSPDESTGAAPSSTIAVGRSTTTVAPTTTVPELDPETQALILELQVYVERVRELSFQQDVAVEFLDDEAFEDRVDEVFTVSAAEAATIAAYYEALGLIPPGSAAAFAEELRERYRSSILGYYDPEIDVLVVRGVQLDGGTRAVLVHELVHALDDQWFDGSRPEYAEDRTTENVDTFEMVTEGNATRVQFQWIAEQPPEVQEEALQHVGVDPSGQVDNFDDILEYTFLAPYRAGTPFVSRLAGIGGERSVDAVLVDPPETTEQVMFPEVFDRREGRVRVPPPPVDGRVIDEGVVGALFWNGLLRSPSSGVSADVAAAAIAGWGGDWQVTWIEEDRNCQRADVVGDTPADTTELFAALSVWVASRPAVTITNVDGLVRMELCYQAPTVGGGSTT